MSHKRSISDNHYGSLRLAGAEIRSLRALQYRLEELSRIVLKGKIYLLQISDTYELEKPLADKEGECGQPPRDQWSQDYRSFPFDGGYILVVEVTTAVLQTEARYSSMEVFDGSPDG